MSADMGRQPTGREMDDARKDYAELLAKLKALQATQEEEAKEWNAGVDAFTEGTPIEDEPSDTRHDLWRAGYIFAALGHRDQPTRDGLLSKVAALRSRVAALEAGLGQYEDPQNWGYTDDSGCPKGHGQYEDACFIGPTVARAALLPASPPPAADKETT